MFINHKKFKLHSIVLWKVIRDIWPKYYWLICITWWWLHLAYYLSKILKIKKIQNLNISSYSGRYYSRIKDITDWIELKKDKKYLIVDDLIDSWKTVELVLKKYSWLCRQLDIATLYHKWKAKSPDYFIKEVSPKERIEFYYEKDIDE